MSHTGTGIAPQLLPHLFEPFRQGDHAHGRQSQGLGLGLSIVKPLVDLHGGSVVAESGSGGAGGAAFTITLPAAAEEPENSAVIQESA